VITRPASPEHAQRLHDERRQRDPRHDRVSCWCCCLDCDFANADELLEQPGIQIHRE